MLSRLDTISECVRQTDRQTVGRRDRMNGPQKLRISNLIAYHLLIMLMTCVMQVISRRYDR